jgi:2-polyprenyl-3-methyl-5-hydroxy-6-metoxy-1,4-benzoquinol methylase
MENNKVSHPDKGLKSVLAKAWAYKLFQMLVHKQNNMVRFVREYIKPYPGCRILDIGCGPAGIVSSLPDSIGEYFGLDMNQNYIKSANLRWSNRSNFEFHCQRIESIEMLQEGHYDIALALGIIHHLVDNESLSLFSMAHKALSAGGVLVTYDPVYTQDQHWFAKWLISEDRGKAVRTVEGYKALASQYFADIEETVLHDELRIPCTIFIMKCHKGLQPQERYEANGDQSLK